MSSKRRTNDSHTGFPRPDTLCFLCVYIGVIAYDECVALNICEALERSSYTGSAPPLVDSAQQPELSGLFQNITL